jgi:cell division protein ZapD
MIDTAQLCGEQFSHFSDSVHEQERVVMKKQIIYEHPLNERMRSWLRMEHLFCHVNFRIKSASPWDSRSAVDGLLEILDFLARNDLKPDLIKELERHVRDFERLQSANNVDQNRLSEILTQIDTVYADLMELDNQLTRQLNEHPLLSSVRQRNNIPGGTCRFDLPAYYFWLQRPPQHRQNELNEWLYALQPLHSAIELCLYLVRNNAMASHEIADAGFFQAKLEPEVNYQLLRVSLPGDYPFFPEISGGKHRFSIRFFEYGTHLKAEQTDENVPFELCCCSV